jgi:beta-galactosidase/beta-glucuronidase
MNAMPRPEHPRPQFYREAWENLNGEWEFAIDRGASGDARGLHLPGTPYPGRITVPFCPESALSGVLEKDFLNCVWYRRTIHIPADRLQGRVLLHFGAVDYRCTVFLNGKACGEHRGGYSSFCFDVTDALRPGDNTLTVRAEDDVRCGAQPSGKQSARYASYECYYTRTTGIWQTVWLEYTPQVSLASVQVDADMHGAAVFTAALRGQGDCLLETLITFEGEPAAHCRTPLHGGCTRFALQVDSPRLWDIGEPNLYDVSYRLYQGGELVDEVRSYLGFRTVELRDHAFYLNGRPVFQRLVLDQGFYPDGVYTAPTDEALKRDILCAQALGFNGARLHQKIFEERFLYWADRLGYLVWGEHASWGLNITGPEGLVNFLPEWLEAVNRDRSHPALIGWCPFNETWDQDFRRQDDRVLRAVYQATKAVDPTRPVIDTSGNFHVATDLYDIHDYEQDVSTWQKRYGAVTEREVYETFPNRQQYGGQPYFISEYGGAWWAPGQDEGWGYGKTPETEEEFVARYVGLTRALMDNKAICGLCYTQLYDVEQEQNGLYTYGREKKFSEEGYRRIREATAAAAAVERPRH